MIAMKMTLRVVFARISRRYLTCDGIEAEDQDDFGLTGGTITAAPVEAQRQTSGRICVELILDVCMSFLAIGPILQSSGEEPTRDRELTDIVLNCDGDEFLLASKAYLVNVRRRALNINLATLDNLLVKFASLSTQYIYQLNDELKLMIIRLLDSTAHLWTQPDIVGYDTVDKVRNFFGWLLELVRVTKDKDGKRTKTKVRSWRVRDTFVAFLARYMSLDPLERFWTTGSSSVDVDHADSNDDSPPTSPTLPSHTLPTINQDEDIRVRFRSAYANATLFNLSRSSNNPMVHYHEIHTSLCTNMEM
jgi:serine-protein kinase ATM